MATLNADISVFKARKYLDLKPRELNPARTVNHTAAKSVVGESDPGDFYWFEDTPVIPFWRRIIVALKYIWA